MSSTGFTILRASAVTALVIAGLVGLPAICNGQFLDLQLQVDSRLAATTEQPLNFGTTTPNTGRIDIGLGDPNMGIFSIRALENQLLHVILQTPSELYHDNPAIEETIPLDLNGRYGYSRQNYQNSNLLPEGGSTIIVSATSAPGPWSILYILMYGSVTITDVPDGEYANEIILNVEYI